MSVLFEDPSSLYAIADRISRHAESVRATGRTLAAVAAATDWHGLAADAFEAEAGQVSADAAASAVRLDDAADAYRRHAAAVESRLQELHRLLDGVVHVGEALAHGAEDGLSAIGSLL